LCSWITFAIFAVVNNTDINFGHRPFTIVSKLNLFILLGDIMNFHAPGSWSTWIIIVCIALLCLVVSAFVSGSEIAYFGLTLAQRKELGEAESASSKIVTMLLNNSERLLATILISK